SDGTNAKERERKSGGPPPAIAGSGWWRENRLQPQDTSGQEGAQIQEGVKHVHGPSVQIPRIVGRNRAQEFNRGESPRMGQALPQIGESEMLPHILALDDEPGKVSLHIDDDPG